MTTDQTTTTYLERTELFDHDHPTITRFVHDAVGSVPNQPREGAVALYYAVRDKVHYEVFGTLLTDDGLRASSVADSGQGFCLHKSILYAAACRSIGIPARVVSAPVRNHLSSPQLRSLVGGEVFLHWLTEVKPTDTWVRATPVFSALMCRLYRMDPLDFDGINDSMHQPYDQGSGATMKFLEDLTIHHDLTASLAREATGQHHPRMLGPELRVPDSGELETP